MGQSERRLHAILGWEGAGAQDGLRCAPHLHSMLAGPGCPAPHAACSALSPRPQGRAGRSAPSTEGGEPEWRGQAVPPTTIPGALDGAQHVWFLSPTA